MRSIRRGIAPAARLSLIAGAFGLWGGVAHAELVVCNASDGWLEVASASEDADSPGVIAAYGQGQLRPGGCVRIIEGVDGGRAHYYHTSEPGFRGDASFCVVSDDSYFYVPDAGQACNGADRRMAEYRRVDLPPGEIRVVVNVDGRGGVLPLPDMPVIDLSRPFVPAPPGGGGGVAPPPAGAAPDYVSGLTPGDYGNAFALEGVWQGCAEDETFGLTCSFHSTLWRFVAPDGDAYPADFLQRLATIPQGAPVSVTGDVLSEGDITAEVALARVQVLPDGPFTGLFDAIQGDWAMEASPEYVMRINGSEVTEFLNGEEVGALFLELGIGCPETGGEGPALRTVTLGEWEMRCFYFDELTDSRMILTTGSADGAVRFLRQ